MGEGYLTKKRSMSDLCGDGNGSCIYTDRHVA